jgi:hypothetical protein
LPASTAIMYGDFCAISGNVFLLINLTPSCNCN